MARDLVGYGRTPPPVEWPDGARVVVNVVLVYEEGSEYSVLSGDERNDGWGEYADAGVQPPPRDLGTKTHNDSRYLVSPGFASPRDFLETLTWGLDELLREGAERRTMMTVAVHARWSGQPARAAALRAFLEHALALEGVRFMRRDEIARWWLECYPPR